METHVKVLAILYIVFSALMAVIGLFILLAIGGASAIVGTTASPEDAQIAVPLMGIAGTLAAFFCFALALPGFLAGFGLLKYQAWARILTIVLSAVQLLNFPLGTILGIYGLWVLLNKDTERLFAPRPAPQP
jgi:dolichol kinase